MLDLIQITNDPVFARRCDALEGMRLWVDLERLGKSERQAGRSTFISTHQLDDVGRIKAVLQRSRLMVRVNPLHEGSETEVDAVLQRGADLLMLPMFHEPGTLQRFCSIVDGRVPVVPLLETVGALATLDQWINTAGLSEVYIGLNDLHLSQGRRFMFEPLARGDVDRVATAARSNGLRFGFGGVARLDEGLLPGRDVLAEHLRLGSQAVILSRTFHRPDLGSAFEAHVGLLRELEREMALRTPDKVAADQQRVAKRILAIAASMPAHQGINP